MATIIRHDCIQELPTGRRIEPIAFSLNDMRGRAGDYLETVRGEAAKIIQEAHRQAEQIRRQAEAVGRKAGEDAVERRLDEKIAKQMETLLPALERTAAQLDEAKGELLANWERSAVRVACAIAERIIRRELASEPQIAIDVIAEALRLAASTSDVTLHVNPSDHEHLGREIERLTETLCHAAPAKIVADAEVSAGGCRITTRFGEIDHQIEAQLRRIEEDLR